MKGYDCTIQLETTCEQELWAGFFGINSNGDQPECGNFITEVVEEESIEFDETGIRPCYSVRCTKCGALLEWPQQWELSDET